MPDLTGRQIALVLGAALAVLTLAVGIYGIITGPQSQRAEGSPDDVSVRVSANAPTETIAPDPSRVALLRTTDPIAFARSVASALFDWDTGSGFVPADYQAPLLAEADPSGEELPGLIDDLATYMPTVDQWLDLAVMDVVQTLEITSAEVPASWASAVAQSHGELRPGTTAVTINGTRTRDGVWNGDTMSKSSSVAFTVFVACRPAFDRCRLLRLSQLDNPLR